MKKILYFLLTICLFPMVGCDSSDEPQVDDTLVLADGFYVYDGFDTASGRHRINFYMSTKDIKSDEKIAYTDVLLYVYALTQPERDPSEPSGRICIMPLGYVGPFLTDGSVGEVELVYYIGKTGFDEQGEENMTGSGWVNYNADGSTEKFYAAETGIHRIEYDEVSKMYIISGEMIDKTAGKTLKYRLSSSNKLIYIPQGM